MLFGDWLEKAKTMNEQEFGFDIHKAFEFLQEKEKRQKPKKYIKHLIKTGQIDRIKPEDLFDEELYFIYHLMYHPQSLNGKHITLNSLNLYGFENVQDLPVESLVIHGYLNLYGCDIYEFPDNIKIGGGGLIFKITDPIPVRFKRNVNAIQNYIESLGGSNAGCIIFCA